MRYRPRPLLELTALDLRGLLLREGTGGRRGGKGNGGGEGRGGDLLLRRQGKGRGGEGGKRRGGLDQQT